MRLAPVAIEHADAMAGWMADPDTAQGLGLRAEPSNERTREWVLRATTDDTVHAYAIYSRDRHVGNVVLDQLDTHLGTARLSIYVGEPDARGRGVAQAAVRQAAARARDELALHKLWLIVHEGNAPARAAYERCGFEVEGRLREEFLLAGRRVDALRMGLLL